MRAYLGEASQRAEPIFVLGRSEVALAALQRKLMAEFPALSIAGAISPPFRPIAKAEDEAMVAQIHASAARTVWVGLKLPRLDKWMQAQRGRVQAVMLGVGAAFDFISGTKPRAPASLRSAGLTWLHRVASEPGRWWKRYSRDQYAVCHRRGAAVAV